jgi:Mn2+/Fe2+ NRAMP family transporter
LHRERHVKKLLHVALGIVTSFGGFLEAGSIATSIQAGAEYGYSLLWVLLIGTSCLIVLIEMSGRLAAMSHHTIAGGMRERFGLPFTLLPLIGVGLVSVLTLAAEVGAVCMALQLATGVGFQWWALPVMLALWLLLWWGTFGVIEDGVSLLGLVTVAFIVAAVKLHPSVGEVAAGFVPSGAPYDAGRYWFLAVSVLGATLTPYLFYFYSSGAVEDRWEPDDVPTNRVVATVGMGFGATLAAAVLIVAAVVFTRGVRLESYDQMAPLLMDALGRWGFPLFVASLGIACFGAALEISLALAYMIAQGFGWNWGKNARPREAARFSVCYTLALVVATALVAVGLDPLRLTNVAMALNAASLPLAVLPFLILMNDREYVGDRPNHRLGNAFVIGVVVLACVLAVVSLPLELLGG